MTDEIKKAKEHFIKGMCSIALFWGFPEEAGAVYAVIYLSEEPISLDEIAERAGLNKISVGKIIKHLVRLTAVNRHDDPGSRKYLYSVETDFWKVTKDILSERENNEFDDALSTVGESLDMLHESPLADMGDPETAFYIDRVNKMKKFFHEIDHIVRTILAFDDLRHVSIKKFIHRFID